jgi:hypothetical protein
MTIGIKSLPLESDSLDEFSYLIKAFLTEYRPCSFGLLPDPLIFLSTSLEVVLQDED